ncbi:adenosylcobinamide-GDP ribazoletransferase [Alsobacter soli]|uniref:Adenosylcobinamide-GDP ribazoletransferase n=1 Tax=Alsobacter soli TaxID=2109933 RepID=A0A2T1HVV6_9HYPH|nr:adenosylcobinamide-GDP ribazoletransferase [Alsobacter soli]PSC05765.1 adenosylcobinamide-GDP ribazoletransferase [Alsobacter soli]
MSIAPADAPPPPAWRDWLTDLAQALRFYTRLPTPRLPWEADPHAAPDFTRLPRVLPLAGAAVGAVAGASLTIAGAFGLPSMASAGLALVALVAVTGGFHEDGLADTADGFGGGATRERRLEIMADSRLGSYGATALVLALLLRFAALASLVTHVGYGRAALALVAASAVARVAGLIPLWALPSARPGGKSASVGRPGDAAMATAFAVTTVLCVLLLAPGFGLPKALGALVAATLSAWPVTRLSQAMLGGQTGDVAGAAGIVAEIAALLALLAHTGG